MSAYATWEFVKAKKAQLKKDLARPKYVNLPPRAGLLWLAVDLDGTLAESVWTADNPTSDIGDPIWSNVAKVREAAEKGYKIHIHTSRAWTDYENIEGWLRHYEIPFRRIECGKLLAARYIDDRALHADEPSWLPTEKGSNDEG